MARLRRTSQVLETARQRLAGLKSITPPPTFGPTVTLNSYDASTAAFAQKLDTYNGTVATLDDLQNDLEADEDTLRELNKRILSAVEAQYGPDSSEYELCAAHAPANERGRQRNRQAAHRHQRRSWVLCGNRCGPARNPHRPQWTIVIPAYCRLLSAQCS